jgi:hypothetical protein
LIPSGTQRWFAGKSRVYSDDVYKNTNLEFPLIAMFDELFERSVDCWNVF